MKNIKLQALAFIFAVAGLLQAAESPLGTLVLEENFADYAKITNGVVTIQGTSITPLVAHVTNNDLGNSLSNDTNAKTATVTIGSNSATMYTTAGESVANNSSAGTATVTIGANAATMYSKSKMDTLLSGKAATATTLSGYGIADAKIEDITGGSKITLGSKYLSLYSWALGSAKPSYTFSELTTTPTTLSGYGITDAKIANGVITLGSDSITPLTSHQSLAGYVPTSRTVNTKALSGNITLYGSDIAMTSTDTTKLNTAIGAKVPLSNMKINGTAITSTTTVELGQCYIKYTTTDGKTTATLYAR